MEGSSPVGTLARSTPSPHTMERHLSPRKTPLAHEWLARRDTRLDRARRALLITVDGRRSGAELAHLAQGLGLDDRVFGELQADGLIAWPTVIAAAPPARVTKPAAALSLAGAKLYALDLVTLMLGGRDESLRALAPEVQSREALVAWCEIAARAIEAHAGIDRAQRFLEKTTAVLPAEA
ncbi:hypothetical protein [Rhizobacter sp. LjRoot28]|uniref:hypothetical protein n=1 Tax=Rhizobacter sp. LjRoot28 TaxID=3342309 RepID=UPI003ECF5D78